MKKVIIIIGIGVLLLYGKNLKDCVREFTKKERIPDLKTENKLIQQNEILSIPLENSPFWTSSYAGYSQWGNHLVDITGDGYPEVITIAEQDVNCMYRNYSGTIEPNPSWQSDWGYHVQADFGDYDNDGDIDMAVAGYWDNTRLYKNENGNLTNTPVWTGMSGSDCKWGDVDNDGDLDLAITNFFFQYPRIYKNDNGNLIYYWSASDYNMSFSISWADIDNDGDFDLLAGGLNWAEPTLRMYKNTNGVLENVASWKTPWIVDSSGPTVGIFPVDIDKDGDLDVAITCGWLEYRYNYIFKNINGTLEEHPSWQSNDANESGVGIFGDLNGDGYLDWAVNDGFAGVVYENINGVLNPQYAWSSNQSGGLGVDIGDVDRDCIIIKEDTLIGTGNKKLFYVKNIPIQRMMEIRINGVVVPQSDYTYHLKLGFVTFKNTPPQNSQIIIKYETSPDLEFLLSDYTTSLSYLYRNNYVKIIEKEKKLPDTRVFFPSIIKNSFLSPNINEKIYSVTGRKEKILNKGIYFLNIQKEGKNTKFKLIKF